ncbi:hypothetical protein [Snodgrassella communis]|uniref:hypothetical protein n=1 Tax=Snodgrassella communis TaxID=2946699 RepID=UPI00286C0D8A|nr:hypothetical protein [Snodgrassella communis]WMY92129.1 hypothetical protein PYG29_01780 [Snodgrassella communis]
MRFGHRVYGLLISVVYEAGFGFFSATGTVVAVAVADAANDTGCSAATVETTSVVSAPEVNVAIAVSAVGG